nr:MAG TPA: hypothetical protein [Caudoviricetes sp.]
MGCYGWFLGLLHLHYLILLNINKQRHSTYRKQSAFSFERWS